MLKHLEVQSLISNPLLESTVLVLKLRQSLGFFTLHSTILDTPAIERRLTHFQGLQHRCQTLARVELRISVSELSNNLLRSVLLPSSRRH